MKFILGAALSMVLATAMALLGCSKVSPDADADIVGIWYDEVPGEYNDAIMTIMDISKDGTMTSTIVSSLDDELGYEECNVNMLWKTEGDKISFSVVDEEEGGEIDYESMKYTIVNGTLILSDEEGNSLSFNRYQ